MRVSSGRYVVGIDLGTTNSAVAYAALPQPTAGGEGTDDAGWSAIHPFEVAQLVAPGEVGQKPGLPSFLYIAGEHELAPGSLALPWDAKRTYAVGLFAREQGARVPGRLVASAKSWLCHGGVDRAAPILPWGAEKKIPKISPVEASRRYLEHIREAWNERMAREGSDHRLEEQLVILTVPASFDEVARELTVRAAEEAGLSRMVLLEEPLAAFYAWLSHERTDWPEDLRDGHLILVCDVGGGTADFSVVGVRTGKGGLRLDRLAVGDHLILGGDNMDHTLARFVEKNLVGQTGHLDSQRWQELVHQCRRAKETLLGGETNEVRVAVMGSGTQLIAGTLEAQLGREEVERLILEGFFPEVPLEESATEPRRPGLTELGLPYAQDPAITRHLARFWRRFEGYLQKVTERTTVYPDFLLFNGGALTPPAVRGRLIETVKGWFQSTAGSGWTPLELPNPRPDLAVATGAAYYGRVRLGAGLRVGSGSPRAYYIGVETGSREEEGDECPAVCVVPRGSEEGFELELEEPRFEALTNQPVDFRVFTSDTRSEDRPGEVVRLSPGDSNTLPRIRTVLRYGKKRVAQSLPVRLAVRLTEIGTLELWCHAEQTEHRWQLEFDVRQEPEAESTEQLVVTTVDEARIDLAREEIAKTLREGGERYGLDDLRKRLEASLEMPREEWPVPLLRALADTLLAVPRGQTGGQEARWLNLLGYTLRPGFGDALDNWRMEQVWKVYGAGLQHPDYTSCRREWWVLWRRVAGGLSANRQAQIYQDIRPHLQPGARARNPSRLYPATLEPWERRESWFALASFERLPVDAKVKLGRWLLDELRKAWSAATTGKASKAGKAAAGSGELWALSRLGARIPTYGPVDCVVPGTEVASWLKTLLSVRRKDSRKEKSKESRKRKQSLAHALVHLARSTGDRVRDVPQETRKEVLLQLARVPERETYRELLLNPETALSHEEQDWVFGESLPAGLVLSSR